MVLGQALQRFLGQAIVMDGRSARSSQNNSRGDNQGPDIRIRYKKTLEES